MSFATVTFDADCPDGTDEFLGVDEHLDTKDVDVDATDIVFDNPTDIDEHLFDPIVIVDAVAVFNCDDDDGNVDNDDDDGPQKGGGEGVDFDETAPCEQHSARTFSELVATVFGGLMVYTFTMVARSMHTTRLPTPASTVIS